MRARAVLQRADQGTGAGYVVGAMANKTPDEETTHFLGIDAQHPDWQRPARPSRQHVAKVFAELVGIPEPMFFEARGIRKAYEVIYALVQASYDVCRVDLTKPAPRSADSAAAELRLAALYEELRDVDTLRLEIVSIVGRAAELYHDLVQAPQSPEGRQRTLWNLSPQARGTFMLQRGLHRVVFDALPTGAQEAYERLDWEFLDRQLARLYPGHPVRGRKSVTEKSVAAEIMARFGMPSPSRASINTAHSRARRRAPKESTPKT